MPEWEAILDGYPLRDDVLKWLRHGVDVHDFFRRFDGMYKGVKYSSSIPPTFTAPNASNCWEFGTFIARTLEEGIVNGSFDLVGRIGRCVLPKVGSQSNLLNQGYAMTNGS